MFSPKNTEKCLTGYYRRFIDGFSKIVSLLNQLLKENIPFNWIRKQQIAFDILKANLYEVPLSQGPDFSQPFIFTTDASGFAIRV